MLKFRKDFSFGIALIFISIFFLFNTNTYSLSALSDNKATLRANLMTDAIDREDDDRRMRFAVARIFLIEVASRIGFTDVIEDNGRIWFEIKTDSGILYRVEDTILIQGDFTKFQDYFVRFQEATASAQRRILEVPQTILRFSKKEPIPIYLCAERDSFLSFREPTVPNPPDWADEYGSMQGELVCDWNGICAMFERRDLGGGIRDEKFHVNGRAHELVHTLIDKCIFNNDRRLKRETRGVEKPSWLEEGLAIALSSPRDIDEDTDHLISLIQKKGFFPTLSSMRESIFSIDDDIVQNNVGYQTCGVFIRYLAQQLDGGYNTILQAMQLMVEERISFEEALFELYVVNVYTIEETFRSQIIDVTTSSKTKVEPVLFDVRRLFADGSLVEERLADVEALIRGLRANEGLIIFVTTADQEEIIKKHHRLSRYKFATCVYNSLPLAVREDFARILKNRTFQRDGYLRDFTDYQHAKKYMTQK